MDDGRMSCYFGLCGPEQSNSNGAIGAFFMSEESGGSGEADERIPSPPASSPAKKTKIPTFARPVFSAELLSEENRAKFDKLPAKDRHLVKRLIDHGDLKRAAQESGVSALATKELNLAKASSRSIQEALEHGGLDTDKLVAHLQDCLEAHKIMADKHGNLAAAVDLNLKLKTIELILKLRGDFDPKTKPGLSGEELFQDTPE